MKITLSGYLIIYGKTALGPISCAAKMYSANILMVKIPNPFSHILHSPNSPKSLFIRPLVYHQVQNLQLSIPPFLLFNSRSVLAPISD